MTIRAKMIHIDEDLDFGGFKLLNLAGLTDGNGDPIGGGGGTTYVLPTASTTVLGGIKVDGTTLVIDAITGVASSVGTTGPTGPTGPQGLQGIQGIQGPAGSGGGSGITTINTQTGPAITIASINGKNIVGPTSISLTTADVAESGNLYCTPANVVAGINTQNITPASVNASGSGHFNTLTIGTGGALINAAGVFFTPAAASFGSLSVGTSGTFDSVTSRLMTCTGGFTGTTAGNLSGFNQISAVTIFASSTGHTLDLAEYVPSPGDADLAVGERLTSGDVAIIAPGDDESIVKHTGIQYDRTVAGVVSTTPGFALGADPDIPIGEPITVDGITAFPMALAGRVPTKVTTTYVNNEGETVRRPILKGYLVVSSSIPGHAMAADPSDFGAAIPFGSLIGKAMQDWNPTVGDPQEGSIKVWVNLG
jgi:hypothetical protein